MTTTREQFEQRLAALGDPWLTRRQVAELAGVAEKTVRNWLAEGPLDPARVRTGPHNAQLIEREAVLTLVRRNLFEPKSGTTALRTGPRLAAEPRRLSHAPGEQWGWADIARRRGVTPGAVSNLAKSYENHPVRPFPRAVGHKRDAGAVAEWFLWYDTERPGYAARRAYGRIPEVVARLEAALAAPEDLTTTRLAYELGVAHTVARTYLAAAAGQLMPRHGLIARNTIADLLAQSGHDGTAEQRRERVRTLLSRGDAPRKHVTVGGTDYYEKAAIERLLSPPRDS
ncbi:helix-turn-helix domain-containing protein [Streptomyces sp. NBC_00986]|uniref:helix-turn-helix domain-containing protein n=1 Tax=Streptomyces sp. NBC_00986 TaxID=2903702 RepID=UPI0038685AD3|nr:helix-turn-helix domain-containing protein [Streptomyces sp. NBC_00986]